MQEPGRSCGGIVHRFAQSGGSLGRSTSIFQTDGFVDRCHFVSKETWVMLDFEESQEKLYQLIR